MKLKNKVAIVTGSGRGFGRATALAFAKEGASVVLAAPEAEEIEAVAKEIHTVGAKALPVVTDIRKKSDVDAMAKAAFQEFDHVDILVNNAGVAIHGPIMSITQEDWDFVQEVNLRGTLFCTQAVFQQMCDQGSGHIINIASTAGKVGSANFANYASSKFGVVGLTEVTDNEGFPFGVKAVAVCPGAGDTKQRSQNHVDETEKLLQPEDIAELILFIVTRSANAHVAEVIMRPQAMRPRPGDNFLKQEILDLQRI